MRTKKQRLFNWLKSSVWAFPVVLLVFFIGLVAFEIHGSSIGVYHIQLNGEEVEDPDLLYGSPKNIRSDEWLGGTQLTALQEETDFPGFNKNLGGSGRDVSKITDAPTKDWVTIFRPHNWSFFVLPFEMAFAFRWWFMLYLLVVSCYFFTLRVLPSRKAFAIITSLAFAISPFILWWYQAALFLPMAYGFLIMILGIRTVDKENIRFVKSPWLRDALYIAGFSFLGLSTAFLLYPPFSVPVILTVCFVLLGFIIQRLLQKKITFKQLLKRASIFMISAVIIVSFGYLFLQQHSDMIDKLSESLYPGQRISSSGALNPLAVLDGFVMAPLQGETRGKNYYGNQSEASNYILLLPFLLLPGIALQLYQYRTTKKIDWMFAATNFVATLFFVRAFVPVGDTLYKFMLLDRVPNKRLVAGIGFVGILQLVFFVKNVALIKINQYKHLLLSIVYSAVCFVVLMLVGRYIIQNYPIFLDNYLVLGGLAFMFSFIIWLFLYNKPLIGACFLLIFTIGSSFAILPLYKGLDVLEDSPIINSIKSVSKPGDYWIPLDNLAYENFPLVAGRGTVGGAQIYPDIDFWSGLDPTGEYQDVYNRQGHATFTTDTKYTDTFTQIQINYYKIKFECSDFIYNKADFVLAIRPTELPCLSLVETVPYPKTTFYLYKITP